MVILIVLAVLVVLAVSATALAAPGGSKKPPTTTTTSATTTTTQPILRTCQTIGTAWILGRHNEAQGNYTVGGLPACIDLRPEHTGTRAWQVDWTGTVKTPPGMRGLRLVFESEVHDLENAYLDTVVYDTSGTLETLIAAPEATPFVFVAMPHSGDKWTSIEIVLTPLP